MMSATLKRYQMIVVMDNNDRYYAPISEPVTEKQAEDAAREARDFLFGKTSSFSMQMLDGILIGPASKINHILLRYVPDDQPS
jgi:hypothetical protein